MSATKKKKTVWSCKCEHTDCLKEWESSDSSLPARCPGCGRYSWNGEDRRRKEFVDTKPTKGTRP
jgi:hypothetical protein